MFYVHTSNRTENLLLHLAEFLRIDDQPDVFQPELFLIQSQGMERLVVQFLADRFGCCGNYRFFLPLDFLTYIATRTGLGLQHDGYERQLLGWRIHGLLAEIPHEQSNWELRDAQEQRGTLYPGVPRPGRSRPSPQGGVHGVPGKAYPSAPTRFSDKLSGHVGSYLSGENSERKHYQLASRLAQLFDQYQIMRPEMINHWQRGRLMTSHTDEPWQMDLWRRLVAQPGGEVHRTSLLQGLIERLDSAGEGTLVLPKRITLVGLHTMPPFFLDAILALARHMDVHLLLLSPCRGYWGERHGRSGVPAAPLTPPAPGESGEEREGHPLLASLGGQGRDLHNILLEKAPGVTEFQSYHDPLEPSLQAGPSLLQYIQADILDDRLVLRDHFDARPDASLHLVSCHSRLRELQVLKDHILGLGEADDPPALHDILVMAPDIQEYSGLIPAVFAEIEHTIADRSLRRRNPVLAAFVTFLELCDGRFGWSEVMDLLAREVVYPQFGLSDSDIEALRSWVQDCGIRWGLSAEQRRDEGLPAYAQTSWRYGLDRMFMGYAVDSDAFIDSILPFDMAEGMAARPLGGLSRFLELLEQGRRAIREKRPVDQWAVVLQGMSRQLCGEDTGRNHTETALLLASLSEAMATYQIPEVGFTPIREWLQGVAEESRSSGGFLSGKLTFCSMLPMRSIPFRIICILGLNESEFPRADIRDTFDLMGVTRMWGDRSRRADDRYQFLEAILAAREHLYLSYVGQSAKTNETIPPSVVLSELLELLKIGFGIDDPVIHHPLHAYSRRYFLPEGRSRLFSYDHGNCQIARTLAGERAPATPWWRSKLSVEKSEIGIAELVRFYRHPQRFFVRDLLGIHQGGPETYPPDSEPFSLAPLERYRLEDTLVTMEERYWEEELRKNQAAALWPLGRAGDLAFAEAVQELQPIRQSIATLDPGERQPDLAVNCTLDGFRLGGTLGNQYERAILLIRCGALRGADLLSGWLYHLIACRLGIDVPTILVTRETTIEYTRDHDEPTLSALLHLFVSGCREPSPLLVEPGFAYVRQQSAARAKLSPLEKAQADLSYRLDQGYEPEWELVFQGRTDDLLGEEFMRLSEMVLGPLWRRYGR